MDSLNLKKEGQSDSQLMQPANRSPESCIKGVAGIKKATLLNDKKTVITQDIYDNTTLWDIITCKKVKDLGNVDYEKAIQTHNPAQWVANWCTIDTKSGDITVHIDEGKCLEAEIYFQDVKPSSVTILNNEDQRSILILT